MNPAALTVESVTVPVGSEVLRRCLVNVLEGGASVEVIVTLGAQTLCRRRSISRLHAGPSAAPGAGKRSAAASVPTPRRAGFSPSAAPAWRLRPRTRSYGRPRLRRGRAWGCSSCRTRVVVQAEIAHERGRPPPRLRRPSRPRSSDLPCDPGPLGSSGRGTIRPRTARAS